MDRKDQLKELINSVDEEKRPLIEKIVEETLFLEERLEFLRKQPFIKIHPEEPTIQRVTAAAKQYKELSQTYNNNIKILLAVVSKITPNDKDPVEEWMEAFKKKYETR